MEGQRATRAPQKEQACRKTPKRSLCRSRIAELTGEFTKNIQKAKLRGRTLSSRGVDTVALHAGLNTSGLSRKVEVEAKFKLARGHDLIGCSYNCNIFNS